MEPFISYAQNFEDVMLWRVLGDVEAGCYVDIGAQSPIVDSVSLAFYERGWRGIHVDANDQYAEELRHARPGDIVVGAAVSSTRGMATFYTLPDTGLSTLDAAVAEEHVSRSGYTISAKSMPMVTLDDVLELAGDREIHWLKVDVEGAEKEVLGGWESGRRPWVIVIESVQPITHEPTYESWEQALLEKGYQFAYADGLNRFYLHKDRNERIGRFKFPPNVFDQFSLSGTATSSFGAYLLQKVSDATQAVRKEDELQNQMALEAAQGALRAAEERLQEYAHRQEHLDWLTRHQTETIDAAEARIQELEANSMKLTEALHAGDAGMAEANGRISELRAALGIAQESVLAASKRMASERIAAETRSFRLEAQVASLGVQTEQRAQVLESVRILAADLQRQLDDARQELHGCRQQIHQFASSTSWRLTAPLRAMSYVARGNLAGARSSIRGMASLLKEGGWTRRTAAKLFPAGTRLGSRLRRIAVDSASPVATVPGLPAPEQRVIDMDEKRMLRLLQERAGVIKPGMERHR
ncbi:FkbM family methyltransferase [Pseudoxanthomonas japonensis]|nr:FkbM family methyltransferase [Pseudoxanthomonas japonensis]